MPGSPIDHTTLVAGTAVAASTLNDNFEAINTYLDGTGLENEYIKNALHNVVLTWHMEEVPVGTARLGFKVPATFSANGLEAVELQVFVSEVNTTGDVTVNIHDDTEFPPTADTRIVPTSITGDSDGDLVTTTDFTQGDHGPTFTIGERFYIEYVVAGTAVNGVTITLFAKADNRS